MAGKLAAYLRHELPLGDLVTWAEEAIQEGDLEAKNSKHLAEVIGRIGVSDVRAFGLAWEDCEQIFMQLGFSARIEISGA